MVSLIRKNWGPVSFRIYNEPLAIQPKRRVISEIVSSVRTNKPWDCSGRSYRLEQQGNEWFSVGQRVKTIIYSVLGTPQNDANCSG